MRVVLLAILICAVLGATSAYIRAVCEHKTLYINCGPKTIVIARATYGRHSKNTCPSINIRTTRCHARSSLGVVRKACQGKRVCRVAASNTVFGDPCKGTPKYLKVLYFCKTSSSALSLSSPKIADTREICQKETSVISCKGKRIYVLRAYYSRRTKMVCPQTANKGRCYKSATFAVRRICHRKPECTLQANNSKYGPKCAGTYLVLKYRCI